MKKQSLLIYSLFIAIVLLFVGTANSPLFSDNGGEEAKCIVTRGK